VRDQLARHLTPAEVSFRGSYAEGTNDGYSDVDLLAEVHTEFTGRFFSALEDRLTELYGPALVRYDPEHEDSLSYQHVRFSFHELLVFWRVDLEIVSSSETAEKWPSPLPEWRAGTSALMNVVWAVKYHRRGDKPKADRYLASACDKLGDARLPYSDANALGVPERLGRRDDDAPFLLAKTREAVMSYQQRKRLNLGNVPWQRFSPQVRENPGFMS
jgi:predicted nucleotidyltransferase